MDSLFEFFESFNIFGLILWSTSYEPKSAHVGIFEGLRLLAKNDDTCFWFLPLTYLINFLR